MLGRRVKELREERKWSQPVLAQLLGIDDTTLSNYENERRQPNPQMVAAMAKVLGVSTDYLLGLTDDRNQPVIYVNIEPDWALFVQNLIKAGYTAETATAFVEETRAFARKHG